MPLHFSRKGRHWTYSQAPQLPVHKVVPRNLRGSTCWSGPQQAARNTWGKGHCECHWIDTLAALPGGIPPNSKAPHNPGAALKMNETS